jgi:hypothetical protein
MRASKSRNLKRRAFTIFDLRFEKNEEKWICGDYSGERLDIVEPASISRWNFPIMVIAAALAFIRGVMLSDQVGTYSTLPILARRRLRGLGLNESCSARSIFKRGRGTEGRNDQISTSIRLSVSSSFYGFGAGPVARSINSAMLLCNATRSWSRRYIMWPAL